MTCCWLPVGCEHDGGTRRKWNKTTTAIGGAGDKPFESKISSHFVFFYFIAVRQTSKGSLDSAQDESKLKTAHCEYSLQEVVAKGEKGGRKRDRDRDRDR